MPLNSSLAPNMAPSTGYTSAAARVAAEAPEQVVLPDFADAITMYRSVTGHHVALAAQFGNYMANEVVRRAYDDVQSLVTAIDAGVREKAIEDYFPSGTRTFRRPKARLRNGSYEINSEEDMAQVLGMAVTTGYELAEDALLQPPAQRNPFPLHWLTPVRVALRLQAAHEAVPDYDRAAAAELLGRVAPSQHVRRIEASLLDLAA